MKNFLLLSAIYLFSPQLATAENASGLRRALIAKMPQVAIGEIRKLPYVALYEIQADDVNVFYVDSKAEVALFGNLVNLKTRAHLNEQRKRELMVMYFSARPRTPSESRLNGGSEAVL